MIMKKIKSKRFRKLPEMIKEKNATDFDIPKISDLIYENKNLHNPTSLVYKTF